MTKFVHLLVGQSVRLFIFHNYTFCYTFMLVSWPLFQLNITVENLKSPNNNGLTGILKNSSSGTNAGSNGIAATAGNGVANGNGIPVGMTKSMSKEESLR